MTFWKLPAWTGLETLLTTLALAALIASCEPAPEQVPLPPRAADLCPPCPAACELAEAPAEAPAPPEPDAEDPAASAPHAEAPAATRPRRRSPAPSTAQASKAQAPPPQDAAAAGSRVNLNTATAAELDRLPGIGPSMAQRIIERRQRRPFRAVRELNQIKGIGRATFRKLEPLVTI